MRHNQQQCQRKNPQTRKPPRPLDEARLRDLALTYVARFATSSAKVEQYLRRKLRERDWEGEEEPDVSALVASFVEKGYIDDASYARARSSDLLRRGYGARRVNEALGQAGITTDLREGLDLQEHQLRHAALKLAQKRRFGPFGMEPIDRLKKEKQVAAMLRAGHSLDTARKLVDAESEEEALEWAHEWDEQSDQF